MFSEGGSNSTVGGSRITSIVGHNWIEGRLKLKVQWDTEQTTWEELKDLKADRPLLTANYIVNKNVSRKSRNDRTMAWAKKTVRDVKRTARRVARLYDCYLDENDEIYNVRRIQNNKKKRRKYKPKTEMLKYGVEVPRNIKMAMRLDETN